jgi:hypothetical protein
VLDQISEAQWRKAGEVAQQELWEKTYKQREKLSKKILDAMRPALNRNGFSAKRIKALRFSSRSLHPDLTRRYLLEVNHDTLGKMLFNIEYVVRELEKEELPQFDLVLSVPYNRFSLYPYDTALVLVREPLNFDDYEKCLETTQLALRSFLEQVYTRQETR